MGLEEGVELEAEIFGDKVCQSEDALTLASKLFISRRRILLIFEHSEFHRAQNLRDVFRPILGLLQLLQLLHDNLKLVV